MKTAFRGMRLISSLGGVAVVTAIAYSLHASAFIAGFLYLFLLMVIAFRWGFAEAAVSSLAAAGCLDFFFTQPLLHLYMRDTQDRIGLACFETTFLVTSRLASRLKRYAATAEEQRRQLEMLYQMSREILFFDRHGTVGSQLTKLITDIFQFDGVSLWNARESRLDSYGKRLIPEEEVRAIGRNEDDAKQGSFRRVLMIGVRPVGSLGIEGGKRAGRVDGRTVDAIASLSAVALERFHSLLTESAAEAARQTERMRSTVLDGLAHSLKTPLATIQTASSGILEMKGIGPAEKELASLINQQSIRLRDLTNEALREARTDRHGAAGRREVIAVDPFLRDFRKECEKDFPGHRLLIRQEVDGLNIAADRRLLRMGLLQLVDNAAKYGTPTAPICLLVNVANAEIVFGVLNEGSYIRPEERMRIFQRFYRSPGSEHRAPGSGLGLSIVRRAAEMHGGRVWTESDPNTGTVFFLTVPLTEIPRGRIAG